MNESFEIIKRLTDALEWAMPYAERGHEREYPGETYEADKNVAFSVYKARSALTLGQEYTDWIKNKPAK